MRELKPSESTQGTELYDEIMRILGPVLPVRFEDRPCGVIIWLRSMPEKNGCTVEIVHTPTTRWTGYLAVKRIEKEPTFIKWLVDPFTGEIKSDIQIVQAQHSGL